MIAKSISVLNFHSHIQCNCWVFCCHFFCRTTWKISTISLIDHYSLIVTLYIVLNVKSKSGISRKNTRS